jgi:hypothetical protein
MDSGSGETLDKGSAEGSAELVVGAIWFLWSRDLANYQFPAGGGTRSVNSQGNCMLSGTYSVAGTDRALPAGANGITESKDLNWVFTDCRHSNSIGDVTMNGNVHEVSTQNGPQGQELSTDNETVTSTALTMTGTVEQQDLSTTIAKCNLQENVQVTMSTTQTYSGNLCDVAFP